jgi:murein DD-endopeptidase MepM/ murein hydrolase activator NlpD
MFSSPSRDSTGSVQPTYHTRELPQYARPATPPLVSAPQSYPASSAQVTSGGGRGMASYSPPSAPIESTGSVTPRSVAAIPPGWTREGGTTIIVGTSDTLDVISKRYNVPAAAILGANNYSGPRVLQPGQQLVIPRQSAHVAAATAPLAAPVPAAAANVHYVNRGDTLANLARRNHISSAQLAAANNLAPNAQLKIGSKLTVPASASPAPPVAAVEAAKPVAMVQPPATKPAAVASAEPVQKAQLASDKVDTPETLSPVKAADATNGLPTFRWPVRGRVIAGYGAKTNGKQNDGINVAVPEGTPVKAAEDGVVAYSGNELKGYGNLVLVRHSNGYVTAYAHASELMVKRGDTIKRGQVIAKSGQTGEVASPQLHFEIRKGSSAVDPLQFLNGA